MAAADLSLGLEDTHVLVTGGAGLIGSVTVSSFLAAGANVTCLDISEGSIEGLKSQISSRPNELSRLECKVADISSEQQLEAAFEAASARFGPVQCCVALASLDLCVLKHHESIMDMPAEQFKRTQEVNVYGTFLTARTWLRQLKVFQGPALKNASLIIVGSESGTFGERTNPDYASSKSAVQGGLLQSLKADVPRAYPGARVNAIAPGPVDTPRFTEECRANPDQLWLDAQATVGLGKAVPIASVAKGIVFLASEAWSGNIHGQILPVDSGKQGKVMWMQNEVR